MEKRYCKYCGKELIRNKRTLKYKKRGWGWEVPSMFSKRIFCNYKCKINLENYHRGYTLWSKEKILKYFKNIKDSNKFYGEYLKSNYNSLYQAIQKYYGFNKLIKLYGCYPQLNKNFTKKRREAITSLKYFREEVCEGKIGEIFSFSLAYGIPGVSIDQRSLRQVIDYLIKLKAIKIYKKGSSSPIIGRYPTQYVLLKTRI